MHIQHLADRFSHPQWNGPMLSTPAETAQAQAANGQPIHPRWELWVQQSALNSRNPDAVNSGGVRAALAFDTADDLLATPVEGLAYRLAMAIAGQAAHEALEWVRLDGDLVIDPHGDLSALQEAADGIVAYLETAGG